MGLTGDHNPIDFLDDDEPTLRPQFYKDEKKVETVKMVWLSDGGGGGGGGSCDEVVFDPKTRSLEPVRKTADGFMPGADIPPRHSGVKCTHEHVSKGFCFGCKRTIDPFTGSPM